MGKINCNKGNILYEILILSEWIEDHDSVVSKNSISNISLKASALYLNPLNFIKRSKVDFLRFLETEYPWQLAVSENGKVVAILQETLLEIKSAKDEFSLTVGKACIPYDQNPKLRKLSWSTDNSLLAVARDSGVVNVFNLFGCNVALIEYEQSPNETLYPVAGLCFLHSQLKSTKWSNELLIAYHNGNVKSVLLSSVEGQEIEINIKFSLEDYYPQGITSITQYCNNFLIVAGLPLNNENTVSVWRILNEYPFLKKVENSENYQPKSRSILRFLPKFSSTDYSKTITKLRVSPDNQKLACLSFSGEISLWRMPNVTVIKLWPLKMQPDNSKYSSQGFSSMKNEEMLFPVDIRWWSNEALVVARRNGALSVCCIYTFNNLLGDRPEFLAPSPQIFSIQGLRPGVIALECETECNKRRLELDSTDECEDGETSVLQASIQAALYSVTDIERFEPKRKTPRVKQKTYRMVALKETTPLELYTRKTDNEEYEEALILAETYNLDCDLVYQKRWIRSDMSKDSVHNNLEKVKEIIWVVKECVERVPETLEDTRELLKFGLAKTNFLKGDLLKLKSGKLLSEKMKELLMYRKLLLKFLDKLTIYEKIIGLPQKYSRSEYEHFRKELPVEATVNFARQENCTAVYVMFTSMGDEVLPYWLPVLSNFPETSTATSYSSLLPEIIENEVIPWKVKNLRQLDWSEEATFQEFNHVVGDDFHQNLDDSLKEFRAEVLKVELLEKWYKQRTYEIEKNTGLIDKALLFVNLALERGVKSLNKLRNDLLTLSALVYNVENENITLQQLEILTHFEQCKFLMSKTDSSSFIVDLKNLIVPFSKRCEEQNCHSSFSLLREILLWFSEKSLDPSLEFLKYLKSGQMNPFSLSLIETVNIILDCIYSCPKSDQLETCFLILECLPQREDSMSKEYLEMHNKIDEVEIYFEICEILDRYGVHKSIKYLKENQNSEEAGKDLMRIMADFARKFKDRVLFEGFNPFFSSVSLILSSIGESSVSYKLKLFIKLRIKILKQYAVFESTKKEQKRETLDFNELLSDLEVIRSKMFLGISDMFCYELCALNQMTCECEEIVQSADNILECKRGEENKLIPFERSVELVLEAARIHFEKANHFDDRFILLSQVCLRLIEEPHTVICEELDLIEALQLLEEFGVNILPLQVRKNHKRMDFILASLTAKPYNYKSCHKLLLLAQTLRIYGDDRVKRDGEVLMLIAEYSLKFLDYEYCSVICHQLIAKNFSPAWKIISELALRKDYKVTDDKKFLLGFSILNSPVKYLEKLIESRVELHSKNFLQTET